MDHFCKLSPVGVDPDETFYTLRFMNKIVGVEDEESRWYWIQRFMSLLVIDEWGRILSISIELHLV